MTPRRLSESARAGEPRRRGLTSDAIRGRCGHLHALRVVLRPGPVPEPFTAAGPRQRPLFARHGPDRLRVGVT